MASESSSAGTPSGRRSLGFLVSGTVVSQGAQLSASLLLARLYTPSEFGLYASILAIASVLAVVGVLSYPSGIPLAASDEESRELAWLSIAIASFLAMLTTLGLSAIVVSGASILGWVPDWRHVVFVPFTALAIAIFTTLQWRQSRLGGFAQVSRATAGGGLTQAGSQVALGWIGLGAAGLSTGYLVGRMVNLGLLAHRSRLGQPPQLSALRRAARTWSTLPRWLLPPTVLNLLGTTAITPWVAHNFGLSTAGAFAFAVQMLSAPAALVGQAVSMVLFPRLAYRERLSGVEAPELERYVRGLALLAFPVFLPILVLGQQIFSLVFGSEWTAAGVIASILTPWMALNFISSPLSSFGVVKGRYRRVAAIAALETGSRFGAIAMGGLLGSEVVGLALYSAAGCAFSIYSIAWVLRLAGGRVTGLMREHWRVLCASALVVVVLLAGRQVLNTWMVAGATLLVAGLIAVLAVNALRTAKQ